MVRSAASWVYFSSVFLSSASLGGAKSQPSTCLLSRDANSRHDADNSRFVVDDTPGNAVVSPFVTNQQNQQTQQTQPLLQSTMAQPQHTPVTQTYNVQGTGGGYTTSSYTNTHSGHGNGYSDNALASSSALETPASGVMPLLA